MLCGRFSSLVFNYGTTLEPTRENCDAILRRLNFTRYALGNSKVGVTNRISLRN